MKQIVLGTAGHIDHGKTSLIRALTGIDTDRLAEEKKRGITIELGFAFLTLPSGQRLGVVDVPGHEKFVKNMVAGVTGIDLVAMVIAADEGVMPQTREHLDICQLLGVSTGLVVLTKTDMVEEDWLELVTEDVSEFLQGTFLEDAPIIGVSSTTGQGLDGLKAALDQLVKTIPDNAPSGIFRMPVDRVFTMRGFGTVVTGTIISGQIATGDAVMLYPSGEKTKVRGLQVHNESTDIAQSGMRTAINFQGLEKEAVMRGDVVSTPDALLAGYMVDVSLNLLPSHVRPLKNRAKVRFHTGTSEILGNVILLDTEELAPGQSAFAQMRLDKPLAAMKNDSFVIRGYSPVHTIGGGRILNPVPPKHKRFRKPVTDLLAKITTAPPEELASALAAQSGYKGVRFAELMLMTSLTAKKLNEICQKLLSQKILLLADRESQTFVHADAFADLEAKATEKLSEYHEKNPLKPGMPKEELRSRFRPVPGQKLFSLFLDKMARNDIMVLKEDTVRLARHSVSLGEDQAQLEKDILTAYKESGLMPPYFRDLEKKLPADSRAAKEVLGHIVQQKALVKVKEDLYFEAGAIEDLKDRLRAHFASHQDLTPPQFKELTGASRKYAIPLLEWLDGNKFTLRVGDVRRLREG